VAVAFRAVGARTKAASGGTKTVAMPAGVLAGDALLLVSLTDNRLDETMVSAGWTYMMTAGRHDQSSFLLWPKINFFWKVASGSEGASQSVSYSTLSYPSGTPNIVAFIAAWSGTHATSPFIDFEPDDTTSSAATVDHPIITVSSANSWLITVRGVSDNGADTFTCSVGGDSERVDDTDGFSELSVALYDSNTTVATGPSTLRQTTSSSALTWGSSMSTIAVRPPAVAGTTSAPAQLVEATASAYDATVITVPQVEWECVAGTPIAAYTLGIDWNNDGDYSDVGEDVTSDVLSSGVTIGYGRDQDRQLSPTSAGTMAYELNNANRTYSPENTLGPLSGSLDPARPAKAEVVFSGVTYPLFRGRIDEYKVSVDRSSRVASFTFLDGLSLLQADKLSTTLYQGIRTGDAIGVILDEIGWTAGRDIDPGGTFIKYWWLEETDAMTALQDLVKSEGPPAVAYIAPDGSFTFRDRHHRILRDHSRTSQGHFAAQAMDCDSPSVTGLSFTKPFVYERGWRDVINSVNFEVEERSIVGDPAVVWSSEDTIVFSSGQSRIVGVSASDPFINAITPVSGTDFVKTGAGVVTASLVKTSGQSTAIVYTCTGGTATISLLQLRAQPALVVRTVKVSMRDETSVAAHGSRAYPDEAKWANQNDAEAIASLILLNYANPRPIVKLRIAAKDAEHYGQILNRTVSDRITIKNEEMGLNADFFVERVDHSIERLWTDRPPVHSVTLGCEKDIFDPPDNPFTFDKKGAGFDDGVFDISGSDQGDEIFIFDDPQQGQFDFGVFGT
jgi:hypothetical protein